jgi:hypothetical protein
MNKQMKLQGELLERAMKLRKDEQSEQELFEQIFKLGLYQLEYRRETNPKKAAESKEARRILKIAQSDPALAEKFGLGKRVAL